jgi:ethanolamine ammonia-lyase small subunit
MIDKNTLASVVRDVMTELFGDRIETSQATPSTAKRTRVGSGTDSAGIQRELKLPPDEVSLQGGESRPDDVSDDDLVDICSQEVRQRILIANPLDAEMMDRLRKATTARIGAGRAGSRLNTLTMLTLRANHATARDSVFQDVCAELLDEMKLFSVQTKCTDKNIYLTRPDLGRKLSDEGRKTLIEKCGKHVKAQIYLSDGLSSKAIEANARNILPAIFAGLESFGITCGVPFFVKYGRVGVMDEISELLDAEVTCVLIGERPGLSTAESLSAYLAYRAAVGMPESRRTVVSNIHNDGINAVEAGAYIADIIRIMLEKKSSGVDLSL